MPDLVIPTVGAPTVLDLILRQSAPGLMPWALALYVNDLHPSPESVWSDFVVASFGGYSSVLLAREDWTPATAENGCAVSTWRNVPITWTCTGSPIQTPYGYVVYDPTTFVVIFAQRFNPDQIEPVDAGKKVSLLPRVTLTSCACP